MYGTRDAAMNWQEEVAKEMKKLGIQRGRYNRCLYYHESRNLRTFLHGDDFATVGTNENVTWLKALLEKRCEIKTECIRPAAAGVGSRKVVGNLGASAPKTTNGEPIIEGVEARLLNRVVKVTREGWEFDPDQRHADLIVQELQLTGANGVTSPGESGSREKMDEGCVELNARDTTR